MKLGLQCRMAGHSGGVAAADLGITKGQLNEDGALCLYKMAKGRGGWVRWRTIRQRSDFREERIVTRSCPLSQRTRKAHGTLIRVIML